MKTQNRKLQFERHTVSELNADVLSTVIGGTGVMPNECFLCINTSNGAGGTIIQELVIA